MTKPKLPSFNIFGLDILELQFLYNVVHNKLTDEELEEVEAFLSERNKDKQ